MAGHPDIIRCTCRDGSGRPCRVPHGIWLVASKKAGKPVPVEPADNDRHSKPGTDHDHP